MQASRVQTSGACRPSQPDCNNTHPCLPPPWLQPSQPPRSPPHPPLRTPRSAIDELACPSGFYCPTPASCLRCPAGYFCPPSTIQPVTCNMSLLVDAAPLLKVPDKPLTVVQASAGGGIGGGWVGWRAGRGGTTPAAEALQCVLQLHRKCSLDESTAPQPLPTQCVCPATLQPCNPATLPPGRPRRSACSSWATRCRATRARSTPAAPRCCAPRGERLDGSVGPPKQLRKGRQRAWHLRKPAVMPSRRSPCSPLPRRCRSQLLLPGTGQGAALPRRILLQARVAAAAAVPLPHLLPRGLRWAGRAGRRGAQSVPPGVLPQPWSGRLRGRFALLGLATATAR